MIMSVCSGCHAEIPGIGHGEVFIPPRLLTEPTRRRILCKTCSDKTDQFIASGCQIPAPARTVPLREPARKP